MALVRRSVETSENWANRYKIILLHRVSMSSVFADLIGWEGSLSEGVVIVFLQSIVFQWEGEQNLFPLFPRDHVSQANTRLCFSNKNVFVLVTGWCRLSLAALIQAKTWRLGFHLIAVPSASCFQTTLERGREGALGIDISRLGSDKRHFYLKFIVLI